MLRSSVGATVFSVASALAAPTALASGTITNLGTLSPYSNTSGFALASDGSAAAGNLGGSGVFNAAFRWTISGGGVIQNLTTLAGDTTSVSTGMTADGAIVVGNSSRTTASRAFMWTSGGGMVTLGFPAGNDYAAGPSVSANGAIFALTSGINAQLGSNRAYRLVGGVFENLGTLSPTAPSISAAISADGSTVVGASNTHAFRWTTGTGMVDISLGQSGSWGANAVNADGTVVTGGPGYLYRWSTTGGWQNLGTLPGGNQASGYGITADGNMIVGTSNSFQGQRAILWTSASGIVDLNTYLPLHGVDTTGWQLTYARAINASGTAIVGEGIYNGLNRAWLVTGFSSSNVSCPADFNQSGIVSVQDIFDFLAAYFHGCP